MGNTELMWLVYVVENLTYNGNFFSAISGTIVGVTVLALIISALTLTEYKLEQVVGKWKMYYPTKTVVALIMLFMTLHTILPTRETAIKMAGAYLLQQVVTADKTKELGNAAYNATLRQLTKWSEEVPELSEMVVDAGKDKLVEELKGNQDKRENPTTVQWGLVYLH